MKPTRLHVLSEDERERLAGAALELLDRIGVMVTASEALDLLLSAGARRADEGRILLSEDVVRDALSRAPSRFTLHDRRGGAIEIGSGRSWTKPGGTVARVADYPGWSLRPAARADVARFSRLCDALSGVHAVAPVVEAQDVERSKAEIVTFQETISNTTKFVLACPVEHAAARAWIEMGRIASGTCDLSSEPKVGLLATVLPNLRLDDDCARTTMLAAREGVPLVSMTVAMAGMTCPNTVASATVIQIAGEMFQTALAEIIRPGAPVLWNTGAMVLDMRTGEIGEAGPEHALSIPATTQVARSFGIPSYSCALHCEAKTGDFQAGLEKTAELMAALLAGVDVITNMGMLSRCSAASYEQLLVDHELCAYLRRFVEGVTVSDDTLALDVIDEVGMGGDFVTHAHTARHCRSGEIWYPSLLDRSADGVPPTDLYARAKEQVAEILEAHAPAVDDRVRRDLERYVRDFA